MKAVRIHAYGHSDQIRVEDLPRPGAAAGEVLVKVRAAGLNPVDWKVREGYLRDVLAVHFPLTLGQDIAGEIVETGPDTVGFKAGDAVFGFASGAYAEYVAVRSSWLAQKPKALDFLSAAAIPTPGLTACQLIHDVVQVQPGQRILIHGAAGGVGSIAVQLAALQGGRVIATASESDADELRQLGAAEVIDYKNQRFEAVVTDVDAVVDLVGGDTLARSTTVVKPGGHIVSIVGMPDQAELRKRQIRGTYHRMQRDALGLGKLADLIDRGQLKVRVKQVFPLTLAKEAQDLSQSGRSHGKIVLMVA